MRVHLVKITKKNIASIQELDARDNGEYIPNNVVISITFYI